MLRRAIIACSRGNLAQTYASLAMMARGAALEADESKER